MCLPFMKKRPKESTDSGFWTQVFRKMVDELELNPDKASTHNYLAEQMTLQGYPVAPMTVRNWLKGKNNPNRDALGAICAVITKLFQTKSNTGKINAEEYKEEIIDLYYVKAWYNINHFNDKNMPDFIKFSLNEAYELDEIREKRKHKESDEDILAYIKRILKIAFVFLLGAAVSFCILRFTPLDPGRSGTVSSRYAADEPKILKGADLSGWKTEKGEAEYAAPGESPVGTGDLLLQNANSHSILSANIKGRKIMAQNIASYSIAEDDILDCSHTLEYSFKLPGIPAEEAGREQNGQAVGGSLILCDDTNKINHLITFQWVVNPFSEDYGKVQTWSDDHWRQAGYMPPDNRWHQVVLKLDIKNNFAYAIIDDNIFLVDIVSSPDKYTSGKTEAKAQVDVISLYPDDKNGSRFDVSFRDWTWIWRDQTDGLAERAAFIGIKNWDEVEKDIMVTGTYPKDMEEDLWVFVKPYGGKYYPQSQDNKSLKKSNGMFSARLGVGQNEERGKVFDIVLASASTEISANIAGELSKGNYSGIEHLQPGTKVLAAVRVVRK